MRTTSAPYRTPHVPPAPAREGFFSRILNTIAESLNTMFELIAIVLKVILGLLAVAGVIVLAAMLFALPIMWLWNYTVPFLFHGVPELDFWHAWALGALCGILFKGSSSSSSNSDKK